MRRSRTHSPLPTRTGLVILNEARVKDPAALLLRKMSPVKNATRACFFNNRSATAAASFVLPSIVCYGVNSRAASATGSFVSLRSTQDDRRLREGRGKKKGAAESLPFFLLPKHISLVILSASEGSRSLTTAEKSPMVLPSTIKTKPLSVGFIF